MTLAERRRREPWLPVVPGYEWVFDPDTFAAWQRRIPMAERTELVGALAEAMRQAARASVAKGAQYVPGEPLNLDTDSLWTAVAEGMAKVVDQLVDERLAKDKVDVKRT